MGGKYQETMSLRFIPSSQHASSINSTSFGEAAPSAPALQDVLRTQEGPLSYTSKLNNKHPLQDRVQNWEKQQQSMRLEQYRRIFGMAEPVRRKMELDIVENTTFVPAVVGGSSNIHQDILLNREMDIDFEDIYRERTYNEVGCDFYSEMERRAM